MNKKLLKLYAGLQALFVSGATLASLSACSDKTNEIANNDVIAEVMEITDPQETTTANYDAFDTTTAKTETTKVKTTTTKVYTVDVMDETTTKKGDESVSTETTTVKNDKGTKNSTSRSNTNNDNTYYDNTDNYVIENNGENSYSGRGNSGSSNPNGNSGTSRGNSGTSRGNSGSSNQTPQTQPPIVETQPPVIETQPPVTQPPVTEPPVTEPPVIETQPPVQSYSINDIGYDVCAFSDFSVDLCRDVMSVQGYMLSGINMSYGYSTGAIELSAALAALNSAYMNDDVLSIYFSIFSQNEVLNSKEFIYNFNMVQSTMGNDVDYTKYTINWSDGDFLNRADQAYREGWFDSFIEQNLGNIPNNPGVMGILYSYDRGVHLNINDIDACINQFINRVSQAAFGAQLVY